MPGRTVAYVALCLFVVSWFLPVHEALVGADGSAFGANDMADFEAGTPPGWRACSKTWDMLVNEWNDWRNPVLGVTCLTNAVMVLAGIALMSGARPRVLGFALLGCGILNAGWVYLLLDDMDFVKDLEPGYYLWTLSFFLVGLAFLRGTDE